MPKKTVGEETENPTEETIETPQEDVKLPTAEEQLATLQGELNELKTKYEQTEKGLKTAHSSLTQKDRLIKEKEDIRGEINDLKEMIKVMAVSSAQGRSVDDDDLEGVKKSPDVDKYFKELEQKREAKRYQDKLSETIAGYEQRVNDLGLTQEDESYWEIKKLVTGGHPDDLRIAEIKIRKLEKEKPVDNQPTDGKDKEISELKAQVEKLQKIVSGELDVETGVPSGEIKGVPTKMSDFRKWVSEKPDEYREKKKEVDEMLRKKLIT